MLVEDVAKMPPLERFLYFVRERYDIYIRKLAGDTKPWTDDSILQRYRFCNVRRMDDKVSQWLLLNWYQPNFNHPNSLTAVTLARQLNNVDSLEAIGFPKRWNPKKVEAELTRRREAGLKNYSGAYMITSVFGGTKPKQTVWNVVDVIHRNKPLLDRSSMRATWEALRPFPGFGDFIAGQVVADLRWAFDGDWKDSGSWAPIGPGSRRGLNRLLGKAEKQPMKQDQFLERLQWLIEVCKEKLPAHITNRLEAMDYQNCLCEFDKYERALWGQGKPKQLYR